MNKMPYQPNRTEETSESVLTVLLILLLVFAIVLSAVSLTRCATVEPNTEENTETTTPKTDDPTPPAPQNAIFTNGTVPKMPTVNDATATLTDALHSKNGILVDVENGIVLAGKGADEQIVPASMTKVMTLIVACEKLTEAELDERLTFIQHYYDYPYDDLSTSFAQVIDGNGYTTIDDMIRIEDLLYAIGVESAADCTLMIADYTYGSLSAFVEVMNQKARALGLEKTLFVDPYGNDAPDEAGQCNVTTPREMAVIMAYAMQCDLIRDIMSAATHDCEIAYMHEGVEKTYGRTLYSHLHENGNTEGGKEKIDSRMEHYRNQNNGTKFSLPTTTGKYFGKTGYLDPPPNSFLVFAANGKESGKLYVAVVADLTEAPIFHKTMKDIKTLYDTYVK